MYYDIRQDYEDLLVKQLERLRQQKKVSQRDMSLSIGQSAGYISKIASRHNMPSMATFFWICDYLEVHPKDFFDEQLENPAIIKNIHSLLPKLNEGQLKCLELIMKDLIKREK